MNHFGNRGEVFVRTGIQPIQNRIGNISDTALNWQQLPGKPAAFHFVVEKFQDVSGDFALAVIDGCVTPKKVPNFNTQNYNQIIMLGIRSNGIERKT